ncbi:MAG: hypothetical protein AABZ55_08770 [Bdellovibrionota bacterium]
MKNYKVLLVVICFIFGTISWAEGPEGGGQEGNKGPRGGNGLVSGPEAKGLGDRTRGSKGAEGN